MSKVLVILFPDYNYVDAYEDYVQAFNDCIWQRYEKKGYDLKIVNYKNSADFIDSIFAEGIEANLSFKDSCPCYTETVMRPDYDQIVSDLNLHPEDEIVVCGFHCHNGVKELALKIYEQNKNVLVDTDLTEFFFDRLRLGHFTFDEFDPDGTVKHVLEASANEKVPTSLANHLDEMYSHPIWGVSKDLLKQLNRVSKPDWTFGK